MNIESESDEEILYDYNPEVLGISGDTFFYPINLFTNSIISAIHARNFERAKEMILGGQELNLTDNRGYTCLHVAVESGNILELLLEQESINKNAVSHKNETALFVGLSGNCEQEILMKLINSGCDVTLPNLERVTPLHLAVQKRDIGVANLIIRNGADIDAKDFDGYTPLHEAVKAENYEAVCMLLYYNASTNEKTFYSKATPFMLAISSNNDEQIAEVLLEYVYDFNELDADNFSALMLALEAKSSLCSEIIRRGADVNQSIDIAVLMLEFDNAKLFKSVWEHIDMNILLNQSTPFLLLYFLNCKFPDCEFMECLDMILSSEYGPQFIECDGCPGYSIGYFLISEDYTGRRNIFLSIIYYCLSMGLTLCTADVYMIYEQFGFDSELEAILFTNPNVSCWNTYFSPIGQHICFNSIVNIGRYDWMWCCKYLKSRTYWQYFTNFSYTFDDLDSWTRDIVVTKFTAPDGRVIPSLMELSRDVVRRILYSKATRFFEPYDVIRRLPVPQLIKDILYLKKPIYS